jgi:hypothetical protein
MLAALPSPEPLDYDEKVFVKYASVEDFFLVKQVDC